MDYRESLCVQLDILDKRIRGLIPDTLLMVEHYPVLTMGRLSRSEEVIDRRYFEERAIPVVKTARGGRATYHGPGQLVLYPIMDIGVKNRDIAFYLDMLEKTVANSLNELGVPAKRESGRRGVWSGGKKIAFTGIAVRKWVTYHGVSVNLNNSIEPFFKMHPCGEASIRVTSVREVTGGEIDMKKAREVFAARFVLDAEKEYGSQPGGKTWN